MTFSSMSPGRRKHGGVYVLISLNDAILERLSSFLALILQTISHEPTTLKQQPRRHTKLSSVWGNSAYLQWLLQTCRCTIESLVLGCTTAWLGNSSAQVCKKLQSVANVAQSITQARIPTFGSIYISRSIGRTANIINELSHQSFVVLPAPVGRSLKANTTWLRNSTFPSVIRLPKVPPWARVLSNSYLLHWTLSRKIMCYSGTALELPLYSARDPGSMQMTGVGWTEFVSSHCDHVSFLQRLRFPPTLQRCTGS